MSQPLVHEPILSNELEHPGQKPKGGGLTQPDPAPVYEIFSR